jgi:multisubunit Na+/H+ antiporter MnhC subunit
MNVGFYINIFTAVVLSVIGVILLVGVFTPYIETRNRVIFGVILLGYGIYRFITVYSKIKLLKQQKQIEDLEHKTQDLIHKK